MLEDAIGGLGSAILALAVGTGVIGMIMALWQILFGPKRRCHMCDEVVRPKARKCKHCGERL